MDAERLEAAESVRRFQEISRVQALGGLEFLAWQERVPAGAIAFAAALVIALLVVVFYFARANRQLQNRILQLERRLKRSPIAE
jgi:uncharacterized integral membrane protein